MKKILIIIAVLIAASSAFALDPATVTITNIRSDSANAYVPGGSYYKSSTLLWTNCICYVASTSAVQDLTDITMELRVGSTDTNVPYVPTAMVATSGTWWVSMTTPTNANPVVQMKLTHTNGTTYIYPWKILRTAQGLE